MFLVSKKKSGGNNVFFRDNKASIIRLSIIYCINFNSCTCGWESFCDRGPDCLHLDLRTGLWA